ncbi:hypothetical protein ONS95_008206 [Cadophora gregata]|uniref:uncharacterized protein n=1 Tax=Cadophora gregata TaxID=51156 RepID=UPI0026DA99C7|nr:uncharacterized protein ONS95_008206 [Cadophora gregata]KAK0126619.1 hypothetical protein ONS95_008206 [Cadophora gregata]
MVKLQELIQFGKVRGPAARGLVKDISLDNVFDVESEIRTRHLINGNTQRYTVITFTLDGSELSVTNQDETEAQFRDAATSTTSPVESIDNRRSMSAHTPSVEIASFKKGLETAANRILQKQLNEHNEFQKKRFEKSFKNYNKLLARTLNVIHVKGDAFHPEHELHVSNKHAAKILANNPQIFAEYQQACEQSLIEYRAELKRQYRQQLNDIELECRDWMRANRGFNLDVGALDGLTNRITQATNFEAPLPVVGKSVSDRFTKDILDAELVDTMAEFKELASKPVEEGGLSFARKTVKLKPLFEGIPEPDFDGMASTEEVPAVRLPTDQTTFGQATNQASAALSIINRNKSSSHGQAIASPVFGAHRHQAQQSGLQHNLANQFTPINRPYISPYAPPFHCQSVPTFNPSNDWDGSTDRSLADRSRPSPPENKPTRCPQDAMEGIGSQNSTYGRAKSEDRPEYPSYPVSVKRVLQLPSSPQPGYAVVNIAASIPIANETITDRSQAIGTRSIEPKSKCSSNPLPRAGVFKLPSISQPVSRRITPTLIAPVRHLDESLNNKNHEPHEKPRISSAVATSSIIPTVLRNDSTIECSNSYVKTSLYDADYDEEDDIDYVPPPANLDPNTYVDATLYDEEYVPVPASITPRKSQNQNCQDHYLKNELRDVQPRHRITSLHSHSPPTPPSPPSPFLHETQHMQDGNEYGDRPDYQRFDNEELPSYEDFDDEEAETSRYLSRAPINRGEDWDAISISSGKEDGHDEEDQYSDGQGSENESPYKGNCDSYVPSHSFGAPIDQHLLERDIRPTFAQIQGQDQQANLKRKREDSPLPFYDPSSENVTWGNTLGYRNSRDIGIRQQFRGKTVNQVLQMLMDEEAKKRKRSGGGGGGEVFEAGGYGDE